MTFIDEIKLHLSSGKGGDGVVRWRHDKNKEFGGPYGGDGGHGGDVYIEAVRDLSRLAKYKHITELSAEDGQEGGRENQKGKNGEDLVLYVPVGSVVTNTVTGQSTHFVNEGERLLFLEGGEGGLGNARFKSSTNRTPTQFTPGEPAHEADVRIELEMMVDVGFAGLPNAGKSTLLNELTNANSKVDAYQFTTLEPHLGDLYGFVLADIPGLIEGASSGKGLGHKFLRHIKRTKLILHCIASDSEDVVQTYKTIRNELQNFDEALADRPEIVLVTKRDLVDDEQLEEIKNRLTVCNPRVYTVSALDDESIKAFQDELVKHLRATAEGEVA